MICYAENNDNSSFIIISKKDGSITKEIFVPFKEKKYLSQSKIDGDKIQSIRPAGVFRLTPFNGNWMLLELGSDTVYELLPNYRTVPLIVRTPPIQSMKSEIMLVIRLITDRYYFFDTVINEYNFAKDKGFDRKSLMYDKKTKTLSEFVVYNDDFSTKKGTYINVSTPINQEIATWSSIQAHRLIESLNNGELKNGKLKEIASRLDEEDNPVIQLLKHKK